MNPELISTPTTNEAMPADTNESFPFPFQQHAFCRYEPVEKRIDQARVLVVDNLLRDEKDLSAVAHHELANTLTSQLRHERKIATMAVENILNNIERLVKTPVTRVAHVSELKTAEAEFAPDAIVLSGTLRDFDYYRDEILAGFAEFIHNTRTPVLAICGGHQMVGLSFGARVVTLDNLEQHEQREDRVHEYQYRFIRITDPSDPIFGGIMNTARILRVWQNHGLQLDRVPEGFSLLATSYLWRN
jgi:GMP synthase (glutamine-hydrolysing)